MKKSLKKSISVKPEFKNLRLDLFLVKINLAQSRMQALKWIHEKRVFLKEKALKASYCLKEGDLLDILLPEIEEKPEKGLKPYHKDLDIVFEDEEVLIVNKPAGLVVHPAPGHEEKTLVNILFHQKKLSPGSDPLRPGVVHRLDKDVSGLLILSKTKGAEDHLIEQFKTRQIEREYWAISLRPPSPIEGEIESEIARHPGNRKKFISLKSPTPVSKKAISSYKLFKENESGLSWLKVHLKTGRTHQIRLHLSSISCPIAGDRIYGGGKLSFIKDKSLKEILKNLDRIALHAHKLGFIHPLSKKQMTFKAPWPSDLKILLKELSFNE